MQSLAFSLCCGEKAKIRHGINQPPYESDLKPLKQVISENVLDVAGNPDETNKGRCIESRRTTNGNCKI